MEIPAKIKILGHTIDVVFNETLTQKTDNVGETRLREHKILLQPNVEGCERQKTSIESSFLHEVIHCILDFNHFKPEINNEEFVGRFAEQLYAVLKNNNLLK